MPMKVPQQTPVPESEGTARGPYLKSELIIGLVGAVGTDRASIVEELTRALATCGYTASEIHVSEDVFRLVGVLPDNSPRTEYDRVNRLMDAGDEGRKRTGENAIMALGAASLVLQDRLSEDEKPDKRAYIINSLKRPEEVQQLREVYDGGFYLIGIYADESQRLGHLTRDNTMTKGQAMSLMERDEDEGDEWGQKLRDTFHLADFFRA